VQHCDDDVLALVAMGEVPTSADAAHLRTCRSCQDELDSLRRVVGAVRVQVAEVAAVSPPQRVWDEIAAATGVSVTPRTVQAPEPAPLSAQNPGHGPVQPAVAQPVAQSPIPAPPQSPAAWDAPPLRRARRRGAGGSRRSLLLVAASALVLGAVGGAVGSSLLRPEPVATTAQVVTRVSLAALPVDPQAQGAAQVVSTHDGRQLAVDVSRLGGTNGFYEVWLIDRGVKKMIPLGILHGARGEFSIPQGVDLSQYPIVDVSAEPLDGNPQHSGKSLLRGTIQG
jgi:hypothetical protein